MTNTTDFLLLFKISVATAKAVREEQEGKGYKLRSHYAR